MGLCGDVGGDVGAEGKDDGNVSSAADCRVVGGVGRGAVWQWRMP